MKGTGAVIAKVDMTFVAKPKEGDTVDDLVEKLRASDIPVMEVYGDGVLVGLHSGGLEVGSTNS